MDNVNYVKSCNCLWVAFGGLFDCDTVDYELYGEFHPVKGFFSGNDQGKLLQERLTKGIKNMSAELCREQCSFLGR